MINYRAQKNIYRYIKLCAKFVKKLLTFYLINDKIFYIKKEIKDCDEDGTT